MRMRRRAPEGSDTAATPSPGGDADSDAGAQAPGPSADDLTVLAEVVDEPDGDGGGPAPGRGPRGRRIGVYAATLGVAVVVAVSGVVGASRLLDSLGAESGSRLLADYAAGRVGVDVVSEDGNFSAVFPEAPRHTTRPADDGEAAVEEYRASLARGTFAEVTYVDVAGPALTPTQAAAVLLGAAESRAADLGGVLEAGEPEQLFTLMQLRYEIDYDDGGPVTLQARSVYGGGRIYVITLAAPEPVPGAFERFDESFEFLSIDRAVAL